MLSCAVRITATDRAQVRIRVMSDEQLWLQMYGDERTVWVPRHAAQDPRWVELRTWLEFQGLTPVLSVWPAAQRRLGSWWR